MVEDAHSVGSPGGSNWMMTDTPEKSNPRAATSVHSSTPEVLRENSRKVLVRSACKSREEVSACDARQLLCKEPELLHLCEPKDVSACTRTS